MGKREANPRLWEVALAPQGPAQGHPTHLLSWGSGVSGFWGPYTLSLGDPRESRLGIGLSAPKACGIPGYQGSHIGILGSRDGFLPALGVPGVFLGIPQHLRFLAHPKSLFRKKTFPT